MIDLSRAGTIDQPDGAGSAGGGRCDDRVRFTLRLAGQRLVEVRFGADACASTTADVCSLHVFDQGFAGHARKHALCLLVTPVAFVGGEQVAVFFGVALREVVGTNKHGFPLASQAVEDLVERVDRQVLEVVLVHLHHRCGAAGRETLSSSQRHLAVLRGLSSLYAKPLLAMREHGVRPAERTRQRPANPKLMLTNRVLVEECVERDDALNMRGGKLQPVSHELDHARADPTVLILTEVKRRNARCLLVGVARHDASEFFFPGCGELKLS